MTTLATHEALSTAARPLPISVGMFWEMDKLGLFAAKRVELVEGVIYELAPQGEPHQLSVAKTYDVVRQAFGDGFYVRNQGTLRLSDYTLVDPDIAVVTGDREDFAAQDNPGTALLVIEISVATLSDDRNRKAALYARSGVTDYWIVNVGRRQVEVRRQPVADEASPLGWRYASLVTFDAADTVSPLARPDATIAVADLLPKMRT